MTQVKFSTSPAYKTFDNLFDELFNGNWNNNTKQSSALPATNIFETKEAYHLELNAPGRNKEDFKINIENGLLTISYEKPEEKVAEDYKTVRREFSFKNFNRSFQVNEKIDADNIQAKYENGLLKFWLPKKEQPKNESKQIAIQ
jgi:HSP20 family protein